MNYEDFMEVSYDDAIDEAAKILANSKRLSLRLGFEAMRSA